MDEILHEMHAWMHAYMRSYHTDDADVMLGIRLKEIHTGYVTANARALAQHLGCTPHDTALAEIIGLFHDVGRFRQYAVYQTFNDAQSEDHAELGLKVIAEHDLLSELCAADTELVRFAIKYHNKKEIPACDDRRKIFFAKLIRDADKLDIYRVLLPFLSPDGADKAPKFVPSDAAQEVSPDFIADFAAGRQAQDARRPQDRAAHVDLRHQFCMDAAAHQEPRLYRRIHRESPPAGGHCRGGRADACLCGTPLRRRGQDGIIWIEGQSNGGSSENIEFYPEHHRR